MLTAQHGLADKALAHDEPGLELPIPLVSLHRQGALVQRPRAQPLSLIEKRAHVAVALNFEIVIRGSRPKEAQINQEELATVLQLVVATRRDEVADCDGRHRLERGLCRSVEEIERGIVVYQEARSMSE